MGIDLRMPNIVGNDKEQLVQIRSYLYQLIPQLQWALSNVNNLGESGNQVVLSAARGVVPTGSTGGESPQVTFNSIKDLIIKSADIVDAYYEEINRKLESVYLAQSDFGDYAQKTSQKIEETSTSTTQTFENIQVVITNMGNTIGSIEGDVVNLGQDLSYAQNDINTINDNVSGLEGYVANVEGEVGNLNSTLQDTKTELSGSIDSAKSELSGDINSAKEELSGNIDTAKSELNGRIDNANEVVSDLATDLDKANKDIEAVNGDLQGYKNTVSESIAKAIGDSETGTEALLEGVRASLQGSIDDIDVTFLDSLKDGIAVKEQAAVIGVKAYIKTGLLRTTENGIDEYGIEIGEDVSVNGDTTYSKFARFTSEKLSFFDSNGFEVAYISDKKLYIPNAQITTSFQRGGLIDLIMGNGDIVTKWIGIGG